MVDTSPTPVTPDGWQEPFRPRTDTPGRGASAEYINLRLPLNADGKVDVERLRDKSKQTLTDVLKDEQLKLALGIGEPGAPAIEFDPKLIGAAYDWLAGLEAMLMQLWLHIPAGQAREIWTYTEADKALLVPSTQAVLAKHSPEWMARYKEEVQFIAFFGLITSTKVRASLAVQAAIKKGKEVKEAAAKAEPAGAEGVNRLAFAPEVLT